jgi:hypothetical protein
MKDARRQPKRYMIAGDERPWASETTYTNPRYLRCASRPTLRGFLAAFRKAWGCIALRGKNGRKVALRSLATHRRNHYPPPPPSQGTSSGAPV